MKVSYLVSFSLHTLLLAALFLAKSSAREFDGYPTVLEIELVQIKPVAFEAPELQKLAPRRQTTRPAVKPKKLEGVTIEKQTVAEKPPEEPLKPAEHVKEEKAPEVKSGEAEVKEAPATEPTETGEKVRLDVEEFPFSYYLALLQSRIQNNWEPPVSPARQRQLKRTIIFFKIQRSGRLADITLERKSGDPRFDRAALRAVTLANPLPPLPLDFPRPDLGVHFEFAEQR